MAPKLGYYLISPLEAGSIDHFTFTYSATSQLAVGQIVRIPLGRRESLGIIVSAAETPDFQTKPVSEILDHPPLPSQLVSLAVWLAEYYAASPKGVWQTVLPAGLLVKRRPRPHTGSLPSEATPGTPTKEQRRVLTAIERGPQRSFLLRGVTGSGKTMVYLELAKQVLASGRSVIVLVPEIALTPQIVARFEGAFPARVLHSHSMLTPSQRHSVWLAALGAEQPMIVIGPRSALFLPLKAVGLIIVDEAHETSYKQEQAPRYWADATAAKLASLHDARLVMGSATPNLNQVLLARRERIGLVELEQQVNQLKPAAAEVIDLRDKDQVPSGRTLSKTVASALADTLAEGRQSLLFLNRRGSASALVCSDCGYVATCPNCHLPLTFHADTARLLCHTCGLQQTPPAACPPAAGGCGRAGLRYVGGGTKRVEAEVRQLFPGARVARLDRDSATGHTVTDTYRALRAGEIDILIGTQMIAKGLDLPWLDTVGVVSADTMLHLPDYTASERTFQLLSQVSGRTGRGDRVGRVLIQTYTPDHPAIRAASTGDWHGFIESEFGQRRLLRYPPFSYLLKLTVTAKSAEIAEQKAKTLADSLRLALPALNLLGPAPAFRERAGSAWRWQLIAKSASRAPLLQAALMAPTGWTADLDPADLL